MDTFAWGRRAAGRPLLALLLVLALPLPPAAMAHGDEEHAAKGPHGGILRTAESHHLELLVGNGQARLWVTDRSGAPTSTAGAVGALRLFTGAGGFTARLVPAGANELVAQDNRIKSQAGLKLQVGVTMPGGGSLQSRFAVSDLAGEDRHAEHRH